MMAGLRYLKESAQPETSPKGQLPFIEDEGEPSPTATFIRPHIERKYRVDYDAGPTWASAPRPGPSSGCSRTTYGRTCTYCRWLEPENFEKGPAHFFDHCAGSRPR